jgi:hypothetical protein
MLSSVVDETRLLKRQHTIKIFNFFFTNLHVYREERMMQLFYDDNQSSFITMEILDMCIVIGRNVI